MRPLTPLCLLAIKYSTDKGGRHNTYNHEPNHGTHEYTPSYYDLLNAQRHLVKSVLEVGVNSGGSLRMWRDFFPNARVLGVDIDPACMVTGEERITTFQADATNPHAVANVLQVAGAEPYDLIIDDGSHQVRDQIATLNILAPCLSDIGVYVVEDITRTDKEWHDLLLKHTPAFLTAGLVVPEFKGTGDVKDDVLYVATRRVP